MKFYYVKVTGPTLKSMPPASYRQLLATMMNFLNSSNILSQMFQIESLLMGYALKTYQDFPCLMEVPCVYIIFV